MPAPARFVLHDHLRPSPHFDLRLEEDGVLRSWAVPRIDGNKRLGWLAVVVFCDINGIHLDAPDDDAYDFVISIADGTMSDVGAIAEQLHLSP